MRSLTRCGLLLSILWAGCSASQSFTTPENVLANPDVRTQPEEVYYVELKTSKGLVVLEIHPEWAPVGAKRFRELVDAEFYDECRFFRAVPGFVVQCGMNGDPLVNGQWKDKKLRDDPVLQTNRREYVTFATSGADSRTTQFFFNLEHNAMLDKMGFAPIGRVVQGMDVVEQLEKKYGEEPDQGLISSKGNSYLEANFPELDFIETARIQSRPPSASSRVADKE